MTGQRLAETDGVAINIKDYGVTITSNGRRRHIPWHSIREVNQQVVAFK